MDISGAVFEIQVLTNVANATGGIGLVLIVWWDWDGLCCGSQVLGIEVEGGCG